MPQLPRKRLEMALRLALDEIEHPGIGLSRGQDVIAVITLSLLSYAKLNAVAITARKIKPITTPGTLLF